MANAAGAASKAISGDGHTSNLADQLFILAHCELDVCDGRAHALCDEDSSPMAELFEL
jgi:hypothetical protein